MTSSWEFMNFKTRTRVRRSYRLKMKTTELIVDMMNRFDEKLMAVPQELQQQEPLVEEKEPSTSDPSVEEVLSR